MKVSFTTLSVLTVCSLDVYGHPDTKAAHVDLLHFHDYTRAATILVKRHNPHIHSSTTTALNTLFKSSSARVTTPRSLLPALRRLLAPTQLPHYSLCIAFILVGLYPRCWFALWTGTCGGSNFNGRRWWCVIE